MSPLSDQSASVITRWECPRCGPLCPGDRRTLDRPDYPRGTHTGCPERAVLVEYVRRAFDEDHER